MNLEVNGLKNTMIMKINNISLIVIFALVSCNQNDKSKNTSINDTVKVKAITSNTILQIPSVPVSNTVMTEEYVKSISKIIYLWAWPMVNVHNRVTLLSDVKEPIYVGGVIPTAPIGRLCLLNDYIKPDQRVIACPNQDVVYGVGPFDTQQEPIVLQVPDFGERFWVYQVSDQRTDGFAKLGQMYDTKPGFYLVTGNDWNGAVPKGIVGVIKCPTRYGLILPRVFQTDDPVDKAAVQPIINQINQYPLSEFDGKFKTVDWRKTKTTPPDNSGGGETKWVVPETFFEQLPDIMDEVPPQPGEEALYAQINGLIDAISKNPKLKEAAKKGAIEAEQYLITPLLQFVNVGYPAGFNWTTQNNGAQFGVDYLTRAACAKANIFVNKPNETKYFYQDLDENGNRLNGKNNYTVTFAKGELPPVKGFWSLTLYNKEHFFVPNRLDRYSLGTKNKTLQKNSDGSVTLYVQSTPPSADKVSNWLPAPKDDFSLYLRCYWPEDRVLNESWTVPAVKKIK